MSLERDEAESYKSEQWFNRRWRELVDRAASRGWLPAGLELIDRITGLPGKTLPTDDRARQLSAFLGLGRAERDGLLGLLEQARSGTPARPSRVPRSRGVSGGLRVWPACSWMIRRRVGGLRSSWSSRKSSGWTASRPSGWRAVAGKSFTLAVMMPCAPPRTAAATTCRSSWSASRFPAQVLPSR